MKKNAFEFSNEIVELNQLYKKEAIKLASELRENNKNFFLEIDCSPNGQLNPFFYSNGSKSAEIIKDSAGAFLGKDFDWFEEKLRVSQDSNFATNFSLGERLSLWERVRPNDYQKKLDWSQPFCIKNRNGITKIWHPRWRQIGHNMGLSTMGSITTFIQEDQTYIQKFYAPLAALSLSPQHKMSYRLVFFLSSFEEEPELVGGLWISRASFKIYPGKDSVVGLISPAKF